MATASADHILIVDDDPDICTLVSRFFEKNGFRVSVVPDGKGLWNMLDQASVDLIVLDLMLPDEDGLVLCRNLRATSDLPVIILSARGEDVDRIIGLEMGADDYLPKPFHPRELLARVRSVLRRTRSTMQPEKTARTHNSNEENIAYHFAGWRLDVPTRQLYTPQEEKVFLSGSEFALLRIFLNYPNQVLTREQLLEYSASKESETYDRTIDMQVSRLRRRLREDSRTPELIKTVRGLGYVLSARVEKVGDHT
ncbi:response regulator [Candidatus Magnetaquicoccus inordinatus]|uniref:response regulator n=1 Tax=Candidatus Magnetaquicoccus inordinatus TaxID=2496818 RepID=UPI00102C972D|nr:response regulator [Candidatus Magnetaquicoccus inordinatus]